MTNGANSITLSLPQNINTGASPTFVGLALTGLTTGRMVIVTGGGVLATPTALTNGQLFIGSTGNAPVGAGLTAGASGSIVITIGAGSITIDTAQAITTTSAVTFFTLSDTGTCTGATVYNTGTASQSSTTVTGSGFTSSMAPGIICWPGVTTCSFITTFVSSTTLTTSNTASVSAAAFSLCYNGVESAQGNLAIAGSIYSSLTANRIVITGANGLLSAPTALTNGQLFIGSTGAAPVGASLTPGATGSITIAGGAGTITIDTAQSITTSASPTFVGATLTGVTAKALVYSSATNALTGLTLTNGQLAIGSTGAIPVAATLTSPGGTITITTGAGSLAIDISGTGTITPSSIVAACTVAAGSSTYSTGTVYQSGAIVTGSGTTFPTTAGGGSIQFANGNCAYVLAYLSATQLLVYPMQNQASGNYQLFSGGTQAAEGSTTITNLLRNAGAAALGGSFLVYDTGNASQSSNTVTGVGATFPPAVGGGLMIWATSTGVIFAYVQVAVPPAPSTFSTTLV